MLYPTIALGTPNDDSTSKLTKPRAATYSSQNGPWKASFENTLTKTSNLLARIFSQQNVRQAVDFYETKAHGMGTAWRKAGRNILKRVTSPTNTTNSTSSNLAMPSSATKRSTTSWVAKKAKVAVFGAVTAVRLLWATVSMGLDVALAAVECAGAVALYALDTLCEDE